MISIHLLVLLRQPSKCHSPRPLRSLSGLSSPALCLTATAILNINSTICTIYITIYTFSSTSISSGVIVAT